ncbi:MAG: hypothetical protein OT477_05845 [Chloroflexi bacterium]|nr:hypothetical protein [Chloroflexota bacterium]
MGKKLILLGLLPAQDMHGYQLNKFIEGTLAMCVSLKRPTASLGSTSPTNQWCMVRAIRQVLPPA